MSQQTLLLRLRTTISLCLVPSMALREHSVDRPCNCSVALLISSSVLANRIQATNRKPGCYNRNNLPSTQNPYNRLTNDPFRRLFCRNEIHPRNRARCLRSNLKQIMLRWIQKGTFLASRINKNQPSWNNPGSFLAKTIQKACVKNSRGTAPQTRCHFTGILIDS